jgi:hypothetical protein
MGIHNSIPNYLSSSISGFVVHHPNSRLVDEVSDLINAGQYGKEIFHAAIPIIDWGVEKY